MLYEMITLNKPFKAASNLKELKDMVQHGRIAQLCIPAFPHRLSVRWYLDSLVFPLCREVQGD
jgi:hypothetical protein